MLAGKCTKLRRLEEEDMEYYQKEMRFSHC
jgi:hypothetical protein